MILPIVHGPAPTGDAAAAAPGRRYRAIAEYIHSVLAATGRQGAPPAARPRRPTRVGDAAARQAYFGAKCSRATRRPATCRASARTRRGKALQNALGLRGAAAAAVGAAPAGGAPEGRDRDAHCRREKVQGPLVRIDNFLITVPG